MKRLIAAAAAAALVLGLAIFCNFQTKSTAKAVAQKTGAILASAAAQKTTGQEQEFCRYWAQREPVLSLFMNHTTLQEIGLATVKMQTAANNGEFFEVSAAAREIEYTVQKAYEDEKLRWAVLF